MVDLAVLNSSLSVNIILQSWTQDTFLPFMDTMIRKGFTVSQPKRVEAAVVQSAPLGRKGTTTDIEIDYNTRRIFVQITNNLNSPHENVEEIFAILSAIGYDPSEFTERININVIITIKVDGRSSSFVSKIVKDEFVNKIEKVFNKPLRPVGIRLSSKEPISGSAVDSPFLILIEPLFQDQTDTKFLIQVVFSSSRSDETLAFLKNLYDGLKKIISGMKND
jgi:hypothetical protein